MRSKSDFLYSPHSAWHTEGGGGIGGLQVKAKKKGRPLLLALGCLLRKYLFFGGREGGQGNLCPPILCLTIDVVPKAGRVSLGHRLLETQRGRSLTASRINSCLQSVDG